MKILIMEIFRNLKKRLKQSDAFIHFSTKFKELDQEQINRLPEEVRHTIIHGDSEASYNELMRLSQSPLIYRETIDMLLEMRDMIQQSKK